MYENMDVVYSYEIVFFLQNYVYFCQILSLIYTTSTGSMTMGNINYAYYSPVHITDLKCTGDEESVWECNHNGLEDHRFIHVCPNTHDATVACQEGELHELKWYICITVLPCYY